MGVGGFSIWQLLILVILVVPFWQIFKRAGFSPWLSLVMFIPVVNLVALYMLAFASWPALKSGSA
jgi:hypothetical protein